MLFGDIHAPTLLPPVDLPGAQATPSARGWIFLGGRTSFQEPELATGRSGVWIWCWGAQSSPGKLCGECGLGWGAPGKSLLISESLHW